MLTRRALESPARNLVGGLTFVAVVASCAVAAYVIQGWSFGDALYMSVLTVFTVGYDEVRPIDTPGLRATTMTLIGLGCTGMIFVTGALVQFINAAQFDTLLGSRRMTGRIARMHDHVIVCGFGRIGQQLARELQAAGASLVVIERSETRAAEATEAGLACLRAEATEEETLRRAGIAHARALATVLPDDAANVFITLSARSLKRDLLIIARGEAPSTERKLVQAGADRVVLPAHIGAERIAEILLYPASEETLRRTPILQQELRRLGLDIEVVVAGQDNAWVGQTVAAVAAAAAGAIMIVGLERQGSEAAQPPAGETVIAVGDGLTLLRRSGRPNVALPPDPPPEP